MGVPELASTLGLVDAVEARGLGPRAADLEWRSVRVMRIVISFYFG